MTTRRSRVTQRNNGAVANIADEAEELQRNGVYLSFEGLLGVFNTYHVIGHYLKGLFAQYMMKLMEITTDIGDTSACESLLGITEVLAERVRLFDYAAGGEETPVGHSRGEDWHEVSFGAQLLLDELASAWDDAFGQGGPLTIEQEGSIAIMLGRFQRRLAALPNPYALNFDFPTAPAVPGSASKLSARREDAESIMNHTLAGIFWTCCDALEKYTSTISNWEAALAKDGGNQGQRCRQVSDGSDKLLGQTEVICGIIFLLGQTDGTVNREVRDEGQRYLDKLESSWRHFCHECRPLLGDQENKFFKQLKAIKSEVDNCNQGYTFRVKKIFAARTEPHFPPSPGTLSAEQAQLEAHRAEERKDMLIARLRKAVQHPDVLELESATTATTAMLKQHGLCEEDIPELGEAIRLRDTLRAEASDRRCKARRTRNTAAVLAPLVVREFGDAPGLHPAEPLMTERQKRPTKAELQLARRQKAAAAKAEAKEAAERAALLRKYPRLGVISTAADDEDALPAMECEAPRLPRPKAPVSQRQQLQLKLSLHGFHQVFDAPQPPVRQQQASTDNGRDGREFVDKQKSDVDPFQVRFTHDSISSCFRSGTRIDKAILDISSGSSSYMFPPLEVVWHEGALYSLSNRRLYLSRVLACLGALKTAPAVVLPFDGERVQACKYDARLRRMASKWDRSFSTTNAGASVIVRSRFAHLQTPKAAGEVPKRGRSVHARRVTHRPPRRAASWSNDVPAASETKNVTRGSEVTSSRSKDV